MSTETGFSGARLAVSGFAWVFSGTVAARAVGLAGQIAVGWFLGPEDFGVYALALGISTLVSALRNGGIVQILIRRGREFDALAGPATRFAFAFDLAGAAVLLLIATPQLLRGGPLGLILAGIALSMPLGTLGAIWRARLTVDRSFGRVAIMDLGGAVCWQTAVVGLAAAGAGAASFALPPLLQALFETVAGSRLVDPGHRDALSRIGPRHAGRTLLREAKWVMLSSAAIALAVSGDYFAVALLADTATAGIYLFAFQIVAALGSTVNNAVAAVLPTLLTSVETERDRQQSAYVRTLTALLLVVVPATLGLVLVAPALVHVTWGGRWDAAAPVVAILAACLPAWTLVGLGRAVYDARGSWRSRFVLLALYGAGGMTSAACGALLGGTASVAACVAAFYLVFAAGTLVAVNRHLAVAQRRVWPTVVTVVVVHLLAFFACAEISAFSLWEQWSLARSMLGLAAFALTAVLVNMVFFRTPWQEISSVLLRRRWS